MNHQPYEGWLLSEESLTSEQEQELQTHLQTCGECLQLVNGWQAVFTQIQHSSPVVPTPGFSQRWQARRMEDSARKHNRLTAMVLMIFAGGAVISTLLLVLLQHNGFPSPVDLLLSMVYNFTVLLARTRELSQWFSALFQSVPVFIPILLWILFSTTLCIWVIIWALSVWRLPLWIRSLK